MKTKVIETEFKGKPMFTIFVVDEYGEKSAPEYGNTIRPLVNMGIKKAQALIVHLKELEAFVLENS